MRIKLTNFAGLLLTALIGALPLSGAAQDEEGAGGGMGGLSFGAISFDKVEGEELNLSSSGEVELVGSVTIESDTLGIKADLVTSEDGGKILKAEGAPVRIRQGEGVRAECRHFTYYTETQKSVLEGSPVIYQTNESQTIKTKGDIITITQDEEGNSRINVKRNPGSSNLATMEAIPDPATQANAAKEEKKPAQKVNNSPGIIKLPSID